MMSLKIRELWLEWVAVCKKALLKCKLQICKICGTDAALTTALGITIWREFLFSLTSPLCTTTTNNLDSTFIELHFKGRLTLLAWKQYELYFYEK